MLPLVALDRSNSRGPTWARSSFASGKESARGFRLTTERHASRLGRRLRASIRIARRFDWNVGDCLRATD